MSDNGRKSLAERIVSASVVVGAAHLCLKLAGLIQAKAAAKYLDNTSYETVFVVAFNGVIYSLFLIGEEVIGPGLMPVFMREKDDEGEGAAWDLANTLLCVQTIILLLVTASIICFPEFYISVFTEWTPKEDPDRYALLRKSLVYLAPCLIFLSIGSTTYIILNGYKRFFLAAFGDASWKICVIIALVVGVGLRGMGYEALFFGLLVGSAAKLVTHIIGLGRKLAKVRWRMLVQSRAFQAMLLLMAPLIVGILFAKFRDVFVNIRILTHVEQEGVLQANDLGRKLYTGINWLIPFTLQIALFPFLCELVDKNDLKRLGEVLGNSSRLLLAVFIPGAVCLAVLAEYVSVVIFLGGKAGLQVSLWTGISTACYMIVLPAAAVECVMMQGFFANRKMISVTVIGIICSMLSVLVSFIFIRVVGVEPAQALLVVALSFVFSRIVKSVLLMLHLKRTVPMLPAKETTIFVLRLAVLAVFVGLATWGTLRASHLVLEDGLTEAKQLLAERVDDAGKVTLRTAKDVKVSKKIMLAKGMISGLVGGLVFLLGAWMLQIKEPIQMFMWSWERVAGKLLKRE